MRGPVLVVEPSRSVRHAVAWVLGRREYEVVCVENAAEASLLPHRFCCGIFADQLPDGSAISLAGWFLVEQRVRAVVFFGQSDDVEFRLRASNLGSFINRSEGIHRLERAVAEVLFVETRRCVAGADSQGWVAPSHDKPVSTVRRRRAY